jgi:hypothetical protein
MGLAAAGASLFGVADAGLAAGAAEGAADLGGLSALWAAPTEAALAANGIGDVAAGAAGLAGAGDALGAVGAGAAGAADALGVGAGTTAAAGAADVGAGAGALAAPIGTTPLAAAGPAAASIAAPVGAAPVDLTSAAAGVGAGGAGAAPTDALTLASSTVPDAGAAAGASPAAAAANGIGAPVTGAGTIGNSAWETPAAAGAAGNSGGGGIGSFLGSAGSALQAHPLQSLGVGVAGLGLAKDLFADQAPKGTNALNSLAANSASQGQILQSYLETGTLPPAIQASVNAATQAGISAIKSKYAGMGVAAGSSGEVQDIASLQQQAVYQGATLADQLLQQGLSETQLSSSIYQSLIQNQTAMDGQTTQAIGGLSSALAGGIRLGNSGVTVQQ